MKKKLMTLVMATSMLATSFATTATVFADEAESAEMTFGFVSKTTADPMFVGTFDGFEQACDELGIKAIYRGTDDASAEKEIEIINQFISQGVDGIAVIAADEDALQPVLQQAMSAGISVVSVDSATNPDSRQLHVDFADPVEMGRNMFRAAAKACNNDGQITVLNGDPRVSLFADFNDGIFEEYNSHKNDDYTNIELIEDVAYGYDMPDQSTTEAQALIKNYPDMDVMICPTTVAILSAAKIIQDNHLDIKVTGIGLPSEMINYFENGICDEMYLWDVYEYGALTAYSLKALCDGEITGAVGDTFIAGDMGEYTVEERAVDGGTMVMMGDGMMFDNSNIKEWADKL